jgi:hypothetical protein
MCWHRACCLVQREGNIGGNDVSRRSEFVELGTGHGKRYVELHSSIATLLREHIGQRKSGYVFCTDTNEPLDQSNILKRVLHPIQWAMRTRQGLW